VRALRRSSLQQVVPVPQAQQPREPLERLRVQALPEQALPKG
jgi:hypothetical protein